MTRQLYLATLLAALMLLLMPLHPARAQGGSFGVYPGADMGGVNDSVTHWSRRSSEEMEYDAVGGVVCYAFGFLKNSYCLEREQTRLKACLGRSTDGNQYNCLFCTILAALTEPSLVFSNSAARNLAQLSRSLTQSLAVLSLILITLRAVVQPGAGIENFKEQFKQFGVILVVYIAISASGLGWLLAAASAPLETALAVGSELIRWMSPTGQNAVFSYSPSGAAAGGIASNVTQAFMTLWSQIEVTVFPVTCLALDRMFSSNLAILGGEFFAGLLLAAPYMFIMGIFAAFLVQTLFYYVAMLCLMPLIFVALIMPQTRGLLMAMVKLLLTGALTILMASIAMALTANIIKLYANAMVDELLQQTSFSLAWNLTSFWSLVFVGFMSVILHLLAPRIAANIGGATDSAASAAGVVAAGQLLAAKALGKSREVFFGSGPSLGGVLGGPISVVGGRLANSLGAAAGAAGRFMKGG